MSNIWKQQKKAIKPLQTIPTTQREYAKCVKYANLLDARTNSTINRAKLNGCFWTRAEWQDRK
jgi:hypothetical protein